MMVFRVVLAVAWAYLMWITIHAVTTLGIDAGNVFFADFAHPWRAQFNTDFLMHLALFGSWIAWREKSLPLGILLGLLSIFGGVYTLAYVFVATFRNKGDFRTLLLGRHAA